MARFYSSEDMQRILQKLGIKAVDNALTTRESAQVLTWRAKHENGVDYTYTSNSIRSRIQSKSLTPIGGNHRDNRNNKYTVEDIFALPLYPRRGAGQKQRDIKEVA